MKTTKKVMSLLLLAVLAAGCEPEPEPEPERNALMGWKWEWVKQYPQGKSTINIFFETSSEAKLVNTISAAVGGGSWNLTEACTYTFDGKEGLLAPEGSTFIKRITNDESTQELSWWVLRGYYPYGDSAMVFTRKPL